MSSGSLIVKSGYLTKEGGTIRSWRRRWVILQNGTCSYYKSPSDPNTGKEAKGTFSLPSTLKSVEANSKKLQFCFGIPTKKRTYYFVADTIPERKKWMECFDAAAKAGSGDSKETEHQNPLAMPKHDRKQSVFEKTKSKGLALFRIQTTGLLDEIEKDQEGKEEESIALRTPDASFTAARVRSRTHAAGQTGGYALEGLAEEVADASLSDGEDPGGAHGAKGSSSGKAAGAGIVVPHYSALAAKRIEDDEEDEKPAAKSEGAAGGSRSNRPLMADHSIRTPSGKTSRGSSGAAGAQRPLGQVHPDQNRTSLLLSAADASRDIAPDPLEGSAPPAGSAAAAAGGDGGAEGPAGSRLKPAMTLPELRAGAGAGGAEGVSERWAPVTRVAEKFINKLRVTHTKRMYERFVPRTFLEYLGKKDITAVSIGDALELQLAVLFVDIRGFTSICEGLEPKETMSLINEITARLSPSVTAHDGYIDKFLGDAVMALFASPVNAVRCGLDMIYSMKAYNDSHVKKKQEEIKVGVGINYGRCMLGTVGVTSRMDATVIGNAVNVASRTEGLTKYFGCSVIVTQSVRTALRAAENAEFRFRVLDKVRVVGKNDSTQVLQVLPLGGGGGGGTAQAEEEGAAGTTAPAAAAAAAAGAPAAGNGGGRFAGAAHRVQRMYKAAVLVEYLQQKAAHERFRRKQSDAILSSLGRLPGGSAPLAPSAVPAAAGEAADSAAADASASPGTPESGGLPESPLSPASSSRKSDAGARKGALFRNTSHTRSSPGLRVEAEVRPAVRPRSKRLDPGGMGVSGGGGDGVSAAASVYGEPLEEMEQLFCDEDASCPEAVFFDYVSDEQVQRYDQALALFHNKAFDEASRLLLAQSKVDVPARVLLERCDYYIRKPHKLGENWDGVNNITSK